MKRNEQHKYTEEQRQFIFDHYKGRTAEELADLVNEHFGLRLTPGRMQSFRKRYGLRSGIDGKFKPGQVPHNKGKKGQGGWEPTQFKKGNVPGNYRPVGSERVDARGYTEVKTADPSTWKTKHQALWEEHNGPVPKGHVVIFGDGDKFNFDPDNLILVSRSQLLRLNHEGLIQSDADLTRVAVTIVDLQQKIKEREQ